MANGRDGDANYCSVEFSSRRNHRPRSRRSGVESLHSEHPVAAAVYGTFDVVAGESALVVARATTAPPKQAVTVDSHCAPALVSGPLSLCPGQRHTSPIQFSGLIIHCDRLCSFIRATHRSFPPFLYDIITSTNALVASRHNHARNIQNVKRANVTCCCPSPNIFRPCIARHESHDTTRAHQSQFVAGWYNIQSHSQVSFKRPFQSFAGCDVMNKRVEFVRTL